jgi:hypothetical protein
MVEAPRNLAGKFDVRHLVPLSKIGKGLPTYLASFVARVEE